MTSVATVDRNDKKPTGIISLMESPEARRAITAMLPEGQTYERVMREFYLAAAENPDILKCEPASIVRAVSRAVSWDLVIGSTAFLVPRKGKLCAQQGYRGKIELMVRHRAARMVDAQCVYEKELFRYQQGTSPFVEHHPIMDPQKRGELIGAYAYARLSAYEVKIIVLSVEEIDDIRRQYSHQWKSGALGDIPWYALKTAIHRLAKQIPMSPKLSKLLTDDDDELETDDRETTVAPGSSQPQQAKATVVDPDVEPREPGDEETLPIPF
jgi:phage RecT family recombinase